MVGAGYHRTDSELSRMRGIRQSNPAQPAVIFDDRRGVLEKGLWDAHVQPRGVWAYSKWARKLQHWGSPYAAWDPLGGASSMQRMVPVASLPPMEGAARPPPWADSPPIALTRC